MSQAEVEERLAKFIKYFVELFDVYFSEYYRRVKERSPNRGQFAKMFEEIVGITKNGGEVLEDVPKATTLIVLDILVKCIKAKSDYDNWNKLKKLAPKLLAYGDDSQLIREDLMKAGGEIFAKREAQFMNADSDSGWEYATWKIAQDAVNRVISYLRDSDMGIDSDTISRGVILGESKRYTTPWGLPNFHVGRSITLNKNKITTADMFEKIGVNVDGNHYKPKLGKREREKCDFDHGAWFRLAFEWEKRDQERGTAQLSDGKIIYELSNSPTDKYKYLLIGQLSEDKLKSIEQTMDEDDSTKITKILDQIKKTALKNASETMRFLDENFQEFRERFDRVQLELKNVKKVSEQTQKTAEATLNTTTEIKGIALEIRDKLNQDTEIQAEKPIRFQVKPTIPSFTGREEELGDLHKLVLRDTTTSYLSQITVVHGLGGVGKTQFVRKYANRHLQAGTFFDVVWLNAENAGKLGECFVELAKYCNISNKDILGKEMTIKTIVGEVHEFLRNRTKRSLVIFDNAEQSYNIHDFLPVFEPSTKEPLARIHIVITSQESEWPNRYPDVGKFPLSVLNKKDALDFVHDSLRIERPKEIGIEDPRSQEHPQQPANTEHENITELVNTLQCFPLALEQAVAYIIDTRVTDLEYSVGDYLKEYKEKTKKLLDNGAFQVFTTEYDKTAYTTWDLTVDKIKKVSYGNIAYKIITISSFIDPDSIHREIFFRMKEVKEIDVKNAVRLIVKYSMMTGEPGQKVLSVHRLVQVVMRLKLQENGQFEEHLESALALMESWCKFDEMSLKDVPRVLKIILPHVEALTDHLTQKYPQDTKTQNDIEKSLGWLAQGYHFMKDFQRLEHVLERIMGIIRTLDIKTPLTEITVLFDLADVYNELDKHPDAISALENALEISKRENIQTLMAESHAKTADTYREILNFRKSKEHYHEALKILDNHSKGKDDPYVVINKLTVCLNLRLVDDSIETTDRIKENLAYWEQQKGELKYLFSPKQVMEVGEAYMRVKDGEKAKIYFTKCLKMCEMLPESLFYSRMIGMINDANVKGNLNIDLENNLKKSLSIIKETQGPKHIETVKYMINIANFYFTRGKVEDGIDLMEEALGIARSSNYQGVMSEILIHLGIKYHQEGEYGKAVELTNEGLLILGTLQAESSMKLYEALGALVLVQKNIGNEEQRKEYGLKLARIQERLNKTLESLRDKSK